MKKAITIILVLLMLVSAAACGKNDNSANNTVTPSSESDIGNQQPENGNNAEGAKLTGKLNLIETQRQISVRPSRR